MNWRYVLFGMSAIAIFYGSTNLWTDYQFTSTAIVVAGKILSNDGHSFSYDFEVDNRSYQNIEHLFGSKRSWVDRDQLEQLRPGTSISVLYDRDKPSNARLNSKWNLRRYVVWPGVVSGIGLIFLAAALNPKFILRKFDSFRK